LHERFGKNVQFLAIYIREAHPIDGVLPERQTGTWLMGTPERNLLVENPVSLAERNELAQRCATDMGLSFPVLVDGMDDAVEAAYAGWPERLYLVDLDGTIVYRGDKGPGGFHPEELGKVLEELTSFYGSP
jgi:hypothetical protein